MTSFADYARHYNALYENKDYAAEATYVTDIIRRHAPDSKTLLDLGCGTGRHAMHFSDLGFNVAGVDQSATMLEQARRLSSQRDIKFIQADIRDFNLGAKFDVVVSMFHVVSYLTTNSDITGALRAVRRHLDRDALFIFDFWYGPGVLTDRPTHRLKTVKSDGIEVRRFATPHLNANENIVSIDYAVLLLDDKARRYDAINEQHRMRYYFKPEIDLLLEATGFESIEFKQWMADDAPDDTTWNAVVTARAL